MSSSSGHSTPDPVSDEAKALLYMLSRADTLHDFVGDRSILSKQEVITILNESSELSESALKQHLYNIKSKEENKVSQKNVDDILNKAVAPLVNIDFPNTYTPKIVKRIAGVKVYEPRVVLFYELYENVLKTLYPEMNIGKYVSSDYLVGCKFDGVSDIKYMFGTETTAEKSDFDNATLSYINLGTTEKPASGRRASGLYSLRAPSIRYDKLAPVISNFFQVTSEKKIYLVVDTSGVKLTELGITNSTNIRQLCNVAGDWDGASKSSCEANNTACVSISDNQANPLERSVFGLSTLTLQKEPSSNAKATLNTKIMNIKDVTVEVTPLSQCIQTKKTCPKNIKDFKNIELLDLKRTGDAFQALMAKQLGNDEDKRVSCGKKSIDSEVFVFVTLDHLAFLKARLNSVPCIFTSKDSVTEEKLMILYKPSVRDHVAQKKALLAQLKAALEEYETYIERSKDVQLNKILDDLAKLHKRDFIDEGSPISKLPDNINYSNKGTTLNTLKEFYDTQLDNMLAAISRDESTLSQPLGPLDPIFENYPGVVNPKSVKLVKAIKNTLIAKANQVNGVIQDTTTSPSISDTNQAKNVGKLIEWLPKTIYTLLNTVLYIDIMAKVVMMYQQFEYDNNAGTWTLGINNVQWPEIILATIESTNFSLNQSDGITPDKKSELLKTLSSYITNINTVLSNENLTPYTILNGDNHGEVVKLIQNITKFTKQYDFLSVDSHLNSTFQHLINIDINEYESIFQRIIDIINAGLYGKKNGTGESLHDMIGKMSEGTPRQKQSRLLEISNRFVLSIMNKILETLVSFARVKISSIDIEPLAGNQSQIENLINEIKPRRGGGDEDAESVSEEEPLANVKHDDEDAGSVSDEDDDEEHYIDLTLFSMHNILKNFFRTTRLSVCSHVSIQDVENQTNFDPSDVDTYDDPFDYGLLIKKFQHKILNKLRPNELQTLKDIHTVKNPTITLKLLYEKSYDETKYSDKLHDLEDAVHLYLEEAMYEDRHLYPGLTAFYNTMFYNTMHDIKRQISSLKYDDKLCYKLVEHPKEILQINYDICMMCFPKDQGQESLGEEIESRERKIDSPKDKEIESREKEQRKDNTRIVDALLIATLPKDDFPKFLETFSKRQRPAMSSPPNLVFLNCGGEVVSDFHEDYNCGQKKPKTSGGARIRRHTLADYCFKYYRPYYDLYYEHQNRAK